MPYLDNASTSWPKPEQVKTAVHQWLESSCGSPGRGHHAFAQAAADLINLSRRRLARFFNLLNPNRVVFCASATDALNLALKGLLEEEDHVLISSMEHNSVLRPLRGLERERHIHLEIIPCDQQGRIDPDDLRHHLTPHTRLVVLSHAANVTGTLQPVQMIGELVRQQGAFLLVDAAQSAGIVPIDLQKLQADLLVCSGHKSLYGLPGTGVLLLGERIKKLRHWREGGTGFNSLSEMQPQEWPEAFEAGTPNLPGILALSEGVAFIEEQGIRRIRQKEMELFAQLWHGLERLGITLYGPPPGEERIAILSFNINGWEPEDIGDVLSHNYGIQVRTGLHCSPLAHRTLQTLPQGTVRLSPGYFTSSEEIQQAIQAIANLSQITLP